MLDLGRHDAAPDEEGELAQAEERNLDDVTREALDQHGGVGVVWIPVQDLGNGLLGRLRDLIRSEAHATAFIGFAQ